MKKIILSTPPKLIILTLLICLFATTGQVFAVDNGGQALEIAPPVIILNADPGDIVEAKILLRDISNGDLIVSNQINDFVAAGEDGTPKLIIDESASEPNPYSIKNWITPLSALTLKSKEIKTLPIYINVPINAAPGGYYCVIRFTGTPPELEGTGVSLSASLGALILLRVNGDVTESLAVEEFYANKDNKTSSFFESAPLKISVRLKNNGNTHEQPTGTIGITDMFGKKITVLGVNETANNILPQSIRKFEQDLGDSAIGKKMLFGRYTADLELTYGANKEVIKSSLAFWVIPYRLIILIIVVLIGGFIGLRLFIKRYNEHIVGKALNRRR